MLNIFRLDLDYTQPLESIVTEAFAVGFAHIGRDAAQGGEAERHPSGAIATLVHLCSVIAGVIACYRNR